MRFFVNTSMWTDRFSERELPLLERIKQWGGDGVEIACSQFDYLPVASLRHELKRLELTCTLLASPPTVGQSIIHNDAAARRAGVDYLREAIGIAGQLGATLLVGPLYAHVAWFTGARPTDDEFRWAVEGFRAVVPDLERAGLRIAIEPISSADRRGCGGLRTAEQRAPRWRSASPPRRPPLRKRRPHRRHRCRQSILGRRTSSMVRGALEPCSN